MGLDGRMEIAILGAGNVGAALARRFIEVGHNVRVGVRFPLSEKSRKLADNIGEQYFYSVEEAVIPASVIVIAVPAAQAVAVARQLPDCSKKIIIDTMNIVNGRGPEGYLHTAQALLDNTNCTDVVKCFNTTGAENMINPVFGTRAIDMFMCGNSAAGKQAAKRLALEIGFGTVHDMGGNDRFYLIEQLANVWINQAIFQGEGRAIAVTLIKR